MCHKGGGVDTRVVGSKKYCKIFILEKKTWDQKSLIGTNPSHFFSPGEQGMEQWWERSPPTNVASVWILASTPYEFFVGSLPYSERFFSGYSGFPLSSKTHISKSKSTRNQADEEPLCGCATSKSLLYFIYLKKIYVLKGMPPRPSIPDPVVRQKSFNYTSSYNIIHPVKDTQDLLLRP